MNGSKAYQRGYDDGFNGRAYDHTTDRALSWQHQGSAGVGYAGSDYDRGYSQGRRDMDEAADPRA